MEEVNKKISSLFSLAKIEKANLNVKQISIGGNNRTFKVVLGKDIYIFKEYFKHINDPRDRLESEYSFLNYAQIVAPNWTPKTIAIDRENYCALYEFIEGASYCSENLSKNHVMNAAKFFVALNKPENRKFAAHLPLASESCFSLICHINLIAKRVDRLCEIAPSSQVDAQALEFSRHLKIKSEKLFKKLLDDAKKLKINISEDLSPAQRCISPSDFGFHNAIETISGNPKFIDFEYSGWDDPAKMVGDFFSQLAVPIPNRYFIEFTNTCMSPFSEPENLVKRSYLLAPLYKIKWCCIALNVFLPVSLARRKFANSRFDEGEIKITQLSKARNLLNTLGEV